MASVDTLVLKTFGLLPGAMRGMPFDQKVEALILDHSDVALIVRPMLNSLLAGKMQGIFANLNQMH
jgi:hypothetical protein